jgi:membrane protein
VLRFTGRIAWRAGVRFFDHNGPDRAAAVSYYTLLSLLPLLVFLISLGARVLGSWDAAYQRATFLLQGVLAHNDEHTRLALRQFAEQAARFYAPSLLILAWTSKRVFASLLSALEVVFGHPGRGILKGNLVTLALVGITGVGLLLTMLLAAVGATTEGLLRRLAPPEAVLMFGGLAAFVARHALPVVITMAFLFILYRIAAPAGYTTRHAAGGALLATLLWEGAKSGFAWYLANLARYAGLYGALEGVIVLAIWIELSVSIVLYGGEVVALTGPDGANTSLPPPAPLSTDGGVKATEPARKPVS